MSQVVRPPYCLFNPGFKSYSVVHECVRLKDSEIAKSGPELVSELLNKAAAYFWQKFPDTQRVPAYWTMKLALSKVNTFSASSSAF